MKKPLPVRSVVLLLHNRLSGSSALFRLLFLNTCTFYIPASGFESLLSVVSAFQLSSRTCFPSETKRTLPPPVPPYASLEMPDVPQMQFRFVLTPQARTAPLLWIPSSSHSCSRHNEPALKPNSGSAHAKTQQGTHTHRESGMPRCSDFNNPAPAPATGTTVSQPVSPRSSSARAAARSRGEFVS